MCVVCFLVFFFPFLSFSQINQRLCYIDCTTERLKVKSTDIFVLMPCSIQNESQIMGSTISKASTEHCLR